MIWLEFINGQAMQYMQFLNIENSVFNNLRSLIKTYLHSLVVNRSDSLI